MSGALTVVSASAPLLLEDLGRGGYADIGVPGSGAFDRAAAALAQRLVGNDESEAGLEITMGNVRLRTSETVSAVISGAACSIDNGGMPVAVHEVFSWRAGTEVAVATPARGLRNYLAVRGGLDVRPILGSASTDVLSDLGPAPLGHGSSVRLARRPAADPLVGYAPQRSATTAPLRLRLGPRHAWFTPEAILRLTTGVYAVTPQSNRVGIRLEGPPLHRARRTELPSEPLQRGAIQVPHTGQPIIMGPDHPTTGGYPVIAALLDDDWDRCAQLRPGEEITFVAVAEEDAPAAL